MTHNKLKVGQIFIDLAVNPKRELKLITVDHKEQEVEYEYGPEKRVLLRSIDTMLYYINNEIIKLKETT